MDDNKVTAAILVETVIRSDERLQHKLKEKTIDMPTGVEDYVATAAFLRPWYEAMLKVVSEAR